MHAISIIGLGRAGGALAIALNRAEVDIAELVFRTTPSEIPEIKNSRSITWRDFEFTSAEFMLITTQDQQIREVAERVASFPVQPKVALHVSGSRSSDELGSLRARGVAVGSMHPLVSISDAVMGADRFANAYFCVEGDAEAITAAKTIISILRGRSFTIESAFKPLYHASAVMASGHLTALFDLAVETLSKCGMEAAAARSILFPLIESTVENLRKQMPAKALTGPFARGDVGAFHSHLDALETSTDRNGRNIYLELAERSVSIVRQDSDSSEVLDILGKAISMAKRKTGC